MNKLHILTTFEQIQSLRDYLASEKQVVKSICAYDTEADGKIPQSSQVIGWSISLYDDEGFYIPFKTWTDEDNLCTEAPLPIPKEGHNAHNQLYDCLSPDSLNLAIAMIQDLTEWHTVMHNAPYDVIITLRNFGINLLDSVLSDTILKKHTVDSDPPHGLKECGIKYIGEDAKDEQADLGESVVRNGGKWNKSDKHIWRGDLKYVGKYAAKDTILTLQLDRVLDKPLDELNLRSFYYDELVMPLLKTSTIPMQLEGFPIDVDYFRALKLELQGRIRAIEEDIYYEIQDDIVDLEEEILNTDYTVRPGGRFGEALIEHVGLEIPLATTGKFSTAKKVIEAWKVQELKHANEDQIRVIWYISGDCDKVPKDLLKEVQRKLFDEDNPESISPVNLGSGQQFAKVVYKKWKITSSKVSRKTGEQSFDASVIEALAINRIQEQFEINQADAQEKFEEYMEADDIPKNADWFIKFLRLRKLEKLLSNYVEGILEVQIDGKIYSNMLQFGTTSGRYALRAPNLQNLPAHSELGKQIKRGFVAC